MRYRFAGYGFDDDRGLEGPDGRVPLSGRHARLLQLLLEADGRVVSKDAIADRVWDGHPVSDESIAQALRRLRLALAAPSGATIVETIYGSGVRIAVPVHRQVGTVDSSVATRGTARLAADALVTSARELSAARTPASLRAAIEAARRAVAVDAAHVGAWCTVAELELLGAIRSVEEPRSGAHRAVAAAEQAIALDRECVPALAVRGFVAATVDGAVEAGLGELERALRIDSSYWTARGLHGWALLADGRPQEAVAEARTALDLNPFGSWYSGLYAQYLLFAGEGDAALAAGRDAIRRFPTSDFAFFAMSQIASTLGLHDEAIAAGRRAIELGPESAQLHTPLANALARSGRRAEARARIRSIENLEPPLPAIWLAPAWLALGERQRAADMLDLARAQGAPQCVYARYDPRFAELLAPANVA
jgi:DNA-binding winged helix-turn-helix (wHTH) protein